MPHINHMTTSDEVPAPAPLARSTGTRAPIWEGSHLRCDGLLDVSTATPSVLCQSVFKRSGWVTRPLQPKEVLRAFDIPLYLYDGLWVDQ